MLWFPCMSSFFFPPPKNESGNRCCIYSINSERKRAAHISYVALGEPPIYSRRNTHTHTHYSLSHSHTLTVISTGTCTPSVGMYKIFLQNLSFLSCLQHPRSEGFVRFLLVLFAATFQRSHDWQVMVKIVCLFLNHTNCLCLALSDLFTI